MSGAELATRDDIASVGSEVVTLGSQLRAEIASVRSELKAEIELLRRDLTIRLGSVLIVAVVIILTAIRYLPPPR